MIVFSKLALSIASYNNNLRSIERWKHIFSWCLMSVVFKTFYRNNFDDVALMKSNCFNRNAFKKRVSIAKQKDRIIKIIRFYAVQFTIEIKCLSKSLRRVWKNAMFFVEIWGSDYWLSHTQSTRDRIDNS